MKLYLQWKVRCMKSFLKKTPGASGPYFFKINHERSIIWQVLPIALDSFESKIAFASWKVKEGFELHRMSTPFVHYMVFSTHTDMFSSGLVQYLLKQQCSWVQFAPASDAKCVTRHREALMPESNNYFTQIINNRVPCWVLKRTKLRKY